MCEGIVDDELHEEIVVFLNDLRAEGSVNMNSAAANIAEQFEITRRVARLHLTRWRKDFK